MGGYFACYFKAGSSRVRSRLQSSAMCRSGERRALGACRATASLKYVSLCNVKYDFDTGISFPFDRTNGQDVYCTSCNNVYAFHISDRPTRLGPRLTN